MKINCTAPPNMGSPCPGGDPIKYLPTQPMAYIPDDGYPPRTNQVSRGALLLRAAEEL